MSFLDSFSQYLNSILNLVDFFITSNFFFILCYLLFVPILLYSIVLSIRRFFL